MSHRPLTDRDERALLIAAENRVAEPLRVGAALGRLLRRARGSLKGRESLSCQQPNTSPPRPLPR